MGSHEKEPASPRRAPAPSRSNSIVSSKHSSAHQGSECWEVVDEPRGRIGPGQELERHEGYLLKKRKWPLKGWHKRYFVLEEGILKYATTRQDVLKGKLHGSIDVCLSVMSINRKAQRVDLDTEENIYHLKVPELGLGTGRAELSECQGKLQELNKMLQTLETLHRIPSVPLISNSQTSAAAERPKKGKRTTRIWCTQSFAKDDTIGRAPSQNPDHVEYLQRFHSLSISSDATLDSFTSLHPDEVCVAAFAVSAYASTYYRAGSKPFNPVLGETYECVRPDKGFRFISEQVCHHPPISACHAESDNFIFWQDPMPREHEKNYGFTQFALELNELTPELKRFLPSTDTRLRPDQRYLEEGNVQAAESQKRRIEQLQRDRRRVMEEKLAESLRIS
ncbi:Oxysterol-binding protein-related protein 7 [Chelonia mydas]|uniref:Oxysterol-binding protein n=1 Tax=Chelonia mydas TaxID=8469 RepID=M7B755_CHEMY|nr:Oxysterol-binding protein-related protein 7 [Chelonia mydas]